MRARVAAEVPWVDVAAFAGLALALCYGPRLLEARGGDPLWRVIPPYSPLLAAVVLRTVVRREGFGDARLGLTGIAARHWLAALALPLAWNLVEALPDLLTGACRLEAGALAAGLPGWGATAAGAALFLAGEELGWRSYLLEKLRPAGPVAAPALCGLVWFAWHPDVWIGPRATVGHGAAFLVYVLCLSFVLAWLYEASGSVWPCLALHVFNNVATLRAFKGAWTCAPRPRADLDPAELLPLLLVVAVLWWRGAFRPPPAAAAAPG